jgi:hypothetical protein
MSRTAWWAAPCLALSACGAASVYPFYAEGQAYVDTSLVGVWRDSSSTEGAVFSLQGMQYRILYTDSDGKSAQFVGTLFRLDDRVALDVTVGTLPDSAKSRAPDEYWSLLLPAHVLFYLDWTAHRLAFSGIDADSLKNYLRAQPQAIRHYLSGNDSTLVLDAPAPELQRFVQSFARRPRVLADSTVWLRTPPPGGARDQP